MDNSAFYGTQDNHCISYLEFGQIDLSVGKKTVWDFRLHQKAYDWLMLGRYTNDLLAYRDMTDLVEQGRIDAAMELFAREIHHAQDGADNLAKLCALAAAPDRPSFFEFGQTLFGCIDGMVFTRRLLERLGADMPGVDLAGVTWHGVDISDMFNRLSAVLHPGLTVVAGQDPAELPHRLGAMFAKGVSLHYAVRSAAQLFDLVGRADVALFDFSVNLSGQEEATIGSGKTLRYLGLDEFRQELARRGASLFVGGDSRFVPEKNRHWLYCLLGEPQACARFMAIHEAAKRSLAAALPDSPVAERFLGARNWTGWRTLEEYLSLEGPSR